VVHGVRGGAPVGGGVFRWLMARLARSYRYIMWWRSSYQRRQGRRGFREGWRRGSSWWQLKRTGTTVEVDEAGGGIEGGSDDTKGGGGVEGGVEGGDGKNSAA
jgi:hypothetical protein